MLKFTVVVLRSLANYLEACDQPCGQVDQSPYTLVAQIQQAADTWAAQRDAEFHR